MDAPRGWNDRTYCRMSVCLWVAVLAVVGADLIGWAVGIESLTRGLADWPPMVPSTAVLVGLVGLAGVIQSGNPSKRRIVAGRCLAALAALGAVLVCLEWLSPNVVVLDVVLFPESVQHATSEWPWPGRTSAQTAISVLALSTAVAVTRLDRSRVTRIWPISLSIAAALPLITFLGYFFEALLLIRTGMTTGMAFLTAAAFVVAVAATLAARPDRNPVAWLMSRPDRKSLLRMMASLTGFPLSIGLLRAVLDWAGLDGHNAWAMAIAIGSLAVGVGTFYLSQHEQGLLIKDQLLSKERAESEARYRILADNAVDVVARLRAGRILWISPSVADAFGVSPEQCIGMDLISCIHPDDRAIAKGNLDRLRSVEIVQVRFRMGIGTFHWVDGRAKRYIDVDGGFDDAIIALRIVDDQVASERDLERMAKFDGLTGLTNRVETITRFEAALKCSRSPADYVGVLFCDADHFKKVNDTWGHSVGDQVLSAISERVVGCVRHGDTVGRMGGDELLVLLPGIHNIDEVMMVAEKIRASVLEPIMLQEMRIHASVSIGATIADSSHSASRAIACADDAMYEAKRAGGNCVVSL